MYHRSMKNLFKKINIIWASFLAIAFTEIGESSRINKGEILLNEELDEFLEPGGMHYHPSWKEE